MDKKIIAILRWNFWLNWTYVLRSADNVICSGQINQHFQIYVQNKFHALWDEHEKALFICALWSPAGKGLTSWLLFVVYNCEFVTIPLVSWVRCGTSLYRFLIFAPLLTFIISGPGWVACLMVFDGITVNFVGFVMKYWNLMISYWWSKHYKWVPIACAFLSKDLDIIFLNLFLSIMSSKFEKIVLILYKLKRGQLSQTLKT